MPVKNRIHKLPIELANQIAAGEVIERPASVLKELLENSLDAGSTEIKIQIERGGIGLIRVQDNGCGISKEDLVLALSQHATSKILTFSDLEKVTSFGFRGEALASIASVSRLSLTSSGCRIQKNGRLDNFDIVPQPQTPGTCVEVRDLFYNTPARRKFLRSEKTENQNLEEIFKRIALSHPEVSLTYENLGRGKKLSICRSPEAKTRRVATLCGQQFIKTAHYLTAESNGLTLQGWLAAPTQLRSQADLQYFYVNGRMVRDKVVNHAIRQVYQEFGVGERYPAFILFFTLDPEQVDVNVHPTKHEVRFREARTVHAFLSYSVREALGGSAVTHITLNQVPQLSGTRLDIEDTFESKPLMLLNDELWLGEKSGNLVVVDLKALMCEKIRESLTTGISSRTLLMPLKLRISEKLTKTKIDLNQLGFEWSLLSEDAVLLRKVPWFIKTISPDFESFFEQLLDITPFSKVVEALLDFVSTHEKMTMEEATRFLQNSKASLPFREFTASLLKEKLLN